jgi:hypothetical protein
MSSRANPAVFIANNRPFPGLERQISTTRSECPEWDYGGSQTIPLEDIGVGDKKLGDNSIYRRCRIASRPFDHCLKRWITGDGCRRDGGEGFGRRWWGLSDNKGLVQRGARMVRLPIDV